MISDLLSFIINIILIIWLLIKIFEKPKTEEEQFKQLMRELKNKRK